MRFTLLALVCSITGLMPGCGSDGPRKYSASGKVTWEGEPLAKGYIVVKSMNPAEPSEGAEIKDGQYSLKTVPGPKKVEITAEKDSGKKDRKGGAILENFIPATYNSATTLKMEVTPAGANQFNFDLKAKP